MTSLFGAAALVVVAVATLLVLVLRFRVPAFFALLSVALGSGLAAGLPPSAVIDAVRDGMGGTLGFVAVVVGLGAMLGALLDASGGVRAIADALLARFGPQGTPFALVLVGFLVAIPAFFDVALIILMPIVLGLSRETGRPLIAYALPLLAGLAVTHAFVPPTPGPIAVAEILGADIGWVILLGGAAGMPAAVAAGPLLGRMLERVPSLRDAESPLLERTRDEAPLRAAGAGEALAVILLPVALIVAATLTTAVRSETSPGVIASALSFLGHPFVALLIGCALGWGLFARHAAIGPSVLPKAMARALEPAGLVVLVTGAGGAFKQVLVNSGAGETLAEALVAGGVPLLLFCFLVATIVRVAQGSATVAMITAAGLAAPLTAGSELTAPQTALAVVAIAAGASMTSHVNDSGFWLVSRYLGLTETQTLKSWTVATTVIGVVGFLMACLLSLFFD